MSPEVASAPLNPLERELFSYEKVLKLYDHIFALHTYMTTVANLFILATGAIWSVAINSALGLDLAAKRLLLSFDAVGSFWVSVVFYGALHSSRMRFGEIDDLGRELFPTILAMGRSHYSARFRWATWGKSRTDIPWYLIPAAAFIGSAYLLVRTFCP